MNKKLVKIFTVLMIVIAICSVSANVFAAKETKTSDTTAITPSSINGDTKLDTGSISTIGNNIVKILQTAGVVLSVVILIVLGIKYMAGSAEEKADYKKSMMPYVIGAALIFAASALAQVIYTFFSGWSL